MVVLREGWRGGEGVPIVCMPNVGVQLWSIGAIAHGGSLRDFLLAPLL